MNLEKLLLLCVSTTVLITGQIARATEFPVAEEYERRTNALAEINQTLRLEAAKKQIQFLTNESLKDFATKNSFDLDVMNKARWTIEILGTSPTSPALIRTAYVQDRKENFCKISVEIYNNTGGRSCLPLPFTRYCKGAPFPKGDFYYGTNTSNERIAITSGDCIGDGSKKVPSLRTTYSSAEPVIESSAFIEDVTDYLNKH